ncbi:hypothetical protein [Virgibacillus sp. CBA3643]|uniref:hypothetical protein n=1 Tax=Virgibacillus sp. CBA3643 TaxID=2942278 RepID=UPI0035A3AAB6
MNIDKERKKLLESIDFTKDFVPPHKSIRIDSVNAPEHKLKNKNEIGFVTNQTKKGDNK